MKKIVLVMILVLSGFCIADDTAVPLKLLRAEANENETLIDLTTSGDFASKPAGVMKINNLNTDPRKKNLVFYFCGGTAADRKFGYKIWAWRSENGMAELVVQGTGVLGTQAVVKYPHNGATATSKFWADTLSITSGAQGTPETFGVADGSSADRCAKLYGYNCGYQYIYCEITDADGVTGTEAGLVSVYVTWFK